MDTIDSIGRRPEGRRDAEPAIVVGVPVELDVVRAHLGELLPREADQLFDSIRGDMARCVAEAEAARARVDGGAEERAEHVGVGAGRVLGDEHHRQAVPDGEADRRFGQPEQRVDVPALGELADRA